jgi:polar amino acid transport system substrate-binding protein
MKVRLAYIEEPPFYYTGEGGKVQGSDIELADVVLRAAGATSIELCPTTFGELLSGVAAGRWDMNVPIFVTPDRAQHVAFSVPVWSLGDGFLLRVGNPKGLTSYKSVGERGDARLGVVAGTVQIDAAKAAGVRDSQIVPFKSQDKVVAALLAGKVDAYPSTAVGNRVIAKAQPQLEVIAISRGADAASAFGAYSFNKNNTELLRAVNEQLRKYLGSPDHRARMARYELTASELDSVAAMARNSQ